MQLSPKYIEFAVLMLVCWGSATIIFLQDRKIRKLMRGQQRISAAQSLGCHDRGEVHWQNGVGAEICGRCKTVLHVGLRKFDMRPGVFCPRCVEWRCDMVDVDPEEAWLRRRLNEDDTV